MMQLTNTPPVFVINSCGSVTMRSLSCLNSACLLPNYTRDRYEANDATWGWNKCAWRKRRLRRHKNNYTTHGTNPGSSASLPLSLSLSLSPHLLEVCLPPDSSCCDDTQPSMRSRWVCFVLLSSSTEPVLYPWGNLGCDLCTNDIKIKIELLKLKWGKKMMLFFCFCMEQFIIFPETSSRAIKYPVRILTFNIWSVSLCPLDTEVISEMFQVWCRQQNELVSRKLLTLVGNNCKCHKQDDSSCSRLQKHDHVWLNIDW